MSHPKSEESRLKEGNPFEGLKISDNSILNTLDSRYACQKCSKSRKFFCYSCFCPHPDIEKVIPRVKLPIKIDIIKHQREIDGKSTSAHAAILAPDDIKVYTYPEIPSYEEDGVVLIFPSHTALGITQLFSSENFKELKSEFDVEYPKGYHRSTLLKKLPLTQTNPELTHNSNAKLTHNSNAELTHNSNAELTHNSNAELTRNSTPELTHDLIELTQNLNPGLTRDFIELSANPELTNIEVSHDLNNLKQSNQDLNVQMRNLLGRKLPITRAVFIDSTWNQSKGIYKDDRLRRLPCVVLQNRTSQFWRHQRGSPRWYLATVEAIHQFLLEMHVNAWGVCDNYKGLRCCFTEKSLELYEKFVSDDKGAYNGQYDDLLYFFEHMYKLIHSYYDHDNLFAYKRRMM